MSRLPPKHIISETIMVKSEDAEPLTTNMEENAYMSSKPYPNTPRVHFSSKGFRFFFFFFFILIEIHVCNQRIPSCGVWSMTALFA